MTIDWARHFRIFRLHVIDVLQFRLRALVWFLVGGVNTMVLLLFWMATIRANPGATDLAVPAITSYYVLLMSLSTFGVCHLEDDISLRDIYKGNIYGYLLRPYPYLLIKFQQEIVWRLLGGFWAMLTLIFIWLIGISLHVTSDPVFWILAVVSIFLGMGVSFFMKVMLGLTAVWLTNIRGIVELFTVFEVILTGFILPLYLFPEQFVGPILALPFASTVYAPVALLTQPLLWSEVARIFALQVFWLVSLGFLARRMFRSSMRYYTGVSQ